MDNLPRAEIEAMPIEAKIVLTDRGDRVTFALEGIGALGITPEFLACSRGVAHIGQGKLKMGTLELEILGFDRRRDCYICRYTKGIDGWWLGEENDG